MAGGRKSSRLFGISFRSVQRAKKSIKHVLRSTFGLPDCLTRISLFVPRERHERQIFSSGRPRTRNGIFPTVCGRIFRKKNSIQYSRIMRKGSDDTVNKTLEFLKKTLSQNGHVSFFVVVSAGANQTGWQTTMSDGALKMRVCEPASEHRATNAVIRFLTKTFQVHANLVSIITGKSQRRKLVKVQSR